MESDVITTDTCHPSELGTKEYWDTLYQREIQNHDEDPDDEGTIWFSESNAEKMVLKQLIRLANRGLLSRNASAQATEANGMNGTISSSHQPSRFLDLGTGNGHMLFSLLEDEDAHGQSWKGEMVGVDYSESSIQLARCIAAQRSDDSVVIPRFERWDLLSDSPGEWANGSFEVVLDKGTFDAISLVAHVDGSSRHPCDFYRDKVVPLIRPGYFLFVTSCNWTRDELVQWLAPENGELEFFEEAKYPTFTFGGKAGQAVVTVIFRRKGVRDIT